MDNLPQHKTRIPQVPLYLEIYLIQFLIKSLTESLQLSGTENSRDSESVSEETCSHLNSKRMTSYSEIPNPGSRLCTKENILPHAHIQKEICKYPLLFFWTLENRPSLLNLFDTANQPSLDPVQRSFNARWIKRPKLYPVHQVQTHHDLRQQQSGIFSLSQPNTKGQHTIYLPNHYCTSM